MRLPSWMERSARKFMKATASLLVVAGDDELRQCLRDRLEAEGFKVATETDGEEALRALGLEMPDAVILDLLLPDLDGLAVCRSIRENPETARLPILLLIGDGEQLEEILNLDLHADDFMTKPYNPQELSARVRNLVRRTALLPPGRMIRAGTIEVDLDRYVVRVAGDEVRLTSKEFELLRSLLQAKGRVLRRESLLEKVWGYGQSTRVESRTVDVHIRRLREKLGPEGGFIRTVRNVGYRFEMSLAMAISAHDPSPS